MTQCRACQSNYEPIDRHGFQSFHVCPPLSPAELLAAVPGLDAATAATLIGIERPGHRDENIARLDNGDVGIVAEGLGVDVVIEKTIAVKTLADVVRLVANRKLPALPVIAQ